MTHPVLTAIQRRVLRDLAAGGEFIAALRRSSDYAEDGVLFSEAVGIVVVPTRGHARYRIRNKTAAPLYLATPPLVVNDPGGGLRSYRITAAGLQEARGA